MLGISSRTHIHERGDTIQPIVHELVACIRYGVRCTFSFREARSSEPRAHEAKAAPSPVRSGVTLDQRAAYPVRLATPISVPCAMDTRWAIRIPPDPRTGSVPPLRRWV